MTDRYSSLTGYAVGYDLGTGHDIACAQLYLMTGEVRTVISEWRDGDPEPWWLVKVKSGLADPPWLPPGPWLIWLGESL